MDFKKSAKLFASIIICQLAGAVGTVFTIPVIEDWYLNLEKPFFNPPNWIFGPVWTILFVLMGISLYLVWERNFEVSNEIVSSDKKVWNRWSGKFWSGKWQKVNIILIFSVQIILNILWSAIFFGSQNIGLAFFELLALLFAILYTIINFYRVSKSASYLLIPYFLWVSFAGFLNFAIWMIN